MAGGWVDSFIPLCYDVANLKGVYVMSCCRNAMIQGSSLQATVNNGRSAVLAHHHTT